MVLLVALSFSGCATKTRYIYVNPPSLKLATNKRISVTYRKVKGGYFLNDKEFKKWYKWSVRAMKANWFLNYEVKEYNKWRKELLSKYENAKDNNKK
jgi:hypothetical protein